MKTPFELLEIAEDSDDAAVKKSYLMMVKRFPPERFPAEFQRIREAYETIRTEKDRLKFSLFDTTCPQAQDVLMDIKSSNVNKRPDIDALRKLLTVSIQKMEIAE